MDSLVWLFCRRRRRRLHWDCPQLKLCAPYGTNCPIYWGNTRNSAGEDTRYRSVLHYSVIIKVKVSFVWEILILVLLFVLQELWAKSFLHHDNRHSCFHWPGAVLTLVVVVGLLCCHGSQPEGRWAGMEQKKNCE